MTTDRSLLIEKIRAALTRLAASPILSSRTGIGSIYERYILCCIVEALHREGARFFVRDQEGHKVRRFRFRSSPGFIYSGQARYDYIRVVWSSCIFELHTNIRALSKSNVLNELDISLLEHKEAVDCRSNSRNPRKKKIRMIVECKFRERTLELGVGRGFVGLYDEFPINVMTLVSNLHNDSVEQMVSRHGSTENVGVSPRNPPKVRSFIGWLGTELRQEMRR